MVIQEAMAGSVPCVCGVTDSGHASAGALHGSSRACGGSWPESPLPQAVQGAFPRLRGQRNIRLVDYDGIGFIPAPAGSALPLPAGWS